MSRPLAPAFVAAVALLPGSPAGAEDDPAAGTVQLEPVTVTAARIERVLEDAPAAVDRVDGATVRAGRPRIQLEESLARVPGLHLQNRFNFAQNQRISTRGFGARAPFGIRGIRVRVDGIPETLPDGQSQVDTIDPDIIDRVEIMRGPASALYGNATGGLIDIHTRDGRTIEPAIGVDRGSHGYSRTGVRAGAAEADRDWAASTSVLNYRGFRDHSEVDRRQLNARATRLLANDRDMTVLLSAVDLPTAQDPGGLTRDEVRDDRRQAAPLASRLDAGQRVRQQRAGLVWRDHAALDGRLTTRLFWTRRDFEQQLPFPGSSRVGFDRDFYGTGAELERPVRVLARPATLLTGVELERQVDARDRFEVDIDGEVQQRTVDERQQATVAAAFAQLDVALTDSLDGVAGVRADRIRFVVDDRLGEGDDDASGRRAFDEASYLLGASWAFAAAHRLYFNTATAFETPTFTEFANPEGGGGFNPDIDPQQAINHELGLRGRINGDLRYQVALFRVRTRDEIVPFEQDGRTFYENAARTERRGLEAGAEFRLTRAWTLTGSWTLSDFRFDDFTDREGNTFDGNRLPGLPREQLFLEAAWRQGDRFLALDGRYSGRVFAENENVTEVAGQVVYNLRAGVERSLRSGRAMRFWFGIDNLFDSDHFANIRINANSDQPVDQRRYFEPAPGRILHGGVEFLF